MGKTILWEQDRYLQAWHFSAIAHQDQLYPGSDISYIFHLAMVAMEVMGGFAQAGEGYDQNLAMQCALLHDTIEDTAVTYEQLHQKFGLAVADGVQALTKNPALPKSEQMKDSIDRLLTQPVEVQLVKLADRICNLQSPPYYWSETKINNYRQEAGLIRDRLGHAHYDLAARLDNKIKLYPNNSPYDI